MMLWERIGRYAGLKKTEHWRGIAALLVCYDILAVNMAYFLALWLRFDCRFDKVPNYYLSAWVRFVPFYTIISLITFMLLRLYRSLWRFASFTELIRVLEASIVTAFVHTVGITLLIARMPITYYFTGAILQFLFIIGIRFSYRFVLLLRARRRGPGNAHRRRRCRTDDSAGHRNRKRNTGKSRMHH